LRAASDDTEASSPTRNVFDKGRYALSISINLRCDVLRCTIHRPVIALSVSIELGAHLSIKKKLHLLFCERWLSGVSWGER
jgi:hypothetical protein